MCKPSAGIYLGLRKLASLTMAGVVPQVEPMGEDSPVEGTLGLPDGVLAGVLAGGETKYQATRLVSWRAG